MENKCIVYYSHWNPDKLDRLRFDIITDVNFAFAIPTKEGRLLPLEHKQTAEEVIRLAHKAGRKVCISVGGWSHENVRLNTAWKEGTSTPQKMQTLIEDMLLLMEEMDFDGIDIDWEYPEPEDGSMEQYEELIRLLSEKLKPMGKLLTSAVVGGTNSDGSVVKAASAIREESFQYLDWMNLMTYDCDGEKHSTYEFAKNCVRYWKDERGFAPEKLMLGLPFYGRPSPGAYRFLYEADKDAYEKDMVVKDGREVWYNGRDTIQEKVKLAKEAGFGGVMVWDITEDVDVIEKSLLTAIGEVL